MASLSPKSMLAETGAQQQQMQNGGPKALEGQNGDLIRTGRSDKAAAAVALIEERSNVTRAEALISNGHDKSPLLIDNSTKSNGGKIETTKVTSGGTAATVNGNGGQQKVIGGQQQQQQQKVIGGVMMMNGSAAVTGGGGRTTKTEGEQHQHPSPKRCGPKLDTKERLFGQTLPETPKKKPNDTFRSSIFSDTAPSSPVKTPKKCVPVLERNPITGEVKMPKKITM